MSIDPVSLALTAVLTAGQMAMQATRKIEGQRLDDLNVSLADYGTPLNYSEGLVRSDGCPIFFAEPMKEVYRQRKTKGGKYDQWTYYGTWANLIADQRIAAVTRMWMDKHLVYDVTGAGPITPFSIADGFNIADSIRFYLGTEDQDPDPRMLATVDAKYGTGSCPAYLGVAYGMLVDIPTEKFGNRVPQTAYEWVTEAQPHYPYESKDGRLGSVTFSPDRSRMLSTYGDAYTMWDCASRTPMLSGHFPEAISAPTIANDGTIYGISGDAFSGSAITAFTPDGLALVGSTPLAALYQAELGVYADGNGREHVVTFPLAFITYFYTWTLDGLGSPVLTDTTDIGDLSGWTPRGACTDSYGDVWVCGSYAGFFSAYDDLFLYRLVDTGARPGSIGFVHLNHGHFDNGASTEVVHADGKFFVFWGHYRMIAIDDVTMTIVGDVAISDNVGGGGALNLRNAKPGSTSVWIGFSEIRLTDGSTIRTVDPYDWKTEDSYIGPVYDLVNNALTSTPQYSDFVTWRYLDRVAASTVTLQSVVERVTELVGLDLANIDASALDQEIRGYLWTRGSGKDILDPLLDAYDSFVRPHDFGLEFRKKGDAPSGTFATPMFVRQNDVRYKVTITQDTDLPRYLNFTFADADADHQTNAVTAQRTADAVDTSRDAAINMTTLVLQADEAKQLADRWFRRQWFESTMVENAVTMRELALEPGDVRTIDLDGNQATYRLTSTLIGADGVIACKSVRDDPSLADLSGASGAPMDGRADSVIMVGVIAKGFVLDIPLITDADNSVNPLLYYAAGPYAAGSWPGATIYEATDGEYSLQFATVASVMAATWGYATDALGSANPWLWDRGNSVNIVLKNGMLLSTTEAACNATPTANLAILGDEIFQFTTATLETDGSYTLSGLKRGRRGTEWAVGDHAAGQPFLLLDRVGNVDMGASDLGTDLSFKAVTGGRDTTSAFPIPVAFTGASLKPYAPAQVDAVKDPGTGDWTIDWVRRSRTGGAWTSGTSIPLGEASEQYEVDILNGSGAVVRTYSGLTSPTVTYDAADQAADGGDVAEGDLYVAIYQISASVDRGFPATASF